MRVVNLFDGMRCGRIALDSAGIPCSTYYASEIDKYPMAVANANYPDVIELGDVKGVDGTKLENIDLLMGGFPCQAFSYAGKQRNFDDPRGTLFFEAERVLNEVNPTYFLLENVRMKPEIEAIISERLGVEPLRINSSLVSAQNRNRLYWTNIPNVTQPEDAGITWGGIREYGVADNFYYSEKGLAWIKRHEERTGKKLRVWGDKDKCQMIEASHHKNYSAQRFFGIEDEKGLRYITPKECARAQTIPDSYDMSMVSNSRKYMMIGNGWTVSVISHILSHIN